MRLKVNMLDHFYKDFRYYSFDEYLDGQTFIHMIVVAFQENRVPGKWRFYDFSVFTKMIKNVMVIPDGQYDLSKPLYSQRNENENSEREFLDWKKILTMFILLHSNFDYNSCNIDEYKNSLDSIVNEKEEVSLA